MEGFLQSLKEGILGVLKGGSVRGIHGMVTYIVKAIGRIENKGGKFKNLSQGLWPL